MLIRTRAFALEKRGNDPREYEDAFWPGDGLRDVPLFRCAVADGATEASFSGVWAQILVRTYCRGKLGMRSWQRSLHALRNDWLGRVGDIPLPWYAEEKFRDGAFASLLGFSLHSSPTGLEWNALAVGDTCLFQIRDGRFCASFPITHSSQFDSRPHLISSNERHNVRLGEVMRQASGAVLRGDQYLLVTDALAAWFLSAEESGKEPWTMLETSLLSGDLDFCTWIDYLRRENHLRNDDVTLLVVEIS